MNISKKLLLLFSPIKVPELAEFRNGRDDVGGEDFLSKSPSLVMWKVEEYWGVAAKSNKYYGKTEAKKG